MTLRDLLVHIGFETDDKEIDGLEKKIEGIKTLMESFAAVEVVKGLFEMTEKFGEMAEELHKASVNAGMGVEAFQKLAFAAKQSGIGQEQLGNGLALLSRHLYEAQTGSVEAQKAFQQAGISPGQIMGFKDAGQALAVLSDKMQHTEGAAKRQYLAQSLLGRSGKEMVSFLSQGSGAMEKMGKEAERVGAILDESQVAALVETQHALNELLSVFKALGATIAADFAPSLKDAIDAFVNFYAANKELIQLEVKKWVGDISFAMGFLWAIVRFVAQAILDFAKNHEVLVRRIGEVALALGALISIIFVFKQALFFAQGGLGLLLGTFQTLASVVPWVIGLIGDAAAAFDLLASAESLAEVGLVILEAPIALIIAAIVALGVVLHDAWKVLTGASLKDTWIGQLEGMIVSLLEKIPLVGGLIKSFADMFSGVGDINLGGAFAAAKGFMGNMMPAVTQITNAVGMTGNAPTAAGMAGGTNVQQSINAPITVNVPAGTDHKMVGDKVKEGVKEHLDRVHRETQRSLRSVVAY